MISLLSKRFAGQQDQQQQQNQQQQQEPQQQQQQQEPQQQQQQQLQQQDPAGKQCLRHDHTTFPNMRNDCSYIGIHKGSLRHSKEVTQVTFLRRLIKEFMSIHWEKPCLN